jgi:alanine racemase
MLISAPLIRINLAALRDNFNFLQSRTRTAQTAAVVKANGYGLGIVPVGQTLYAAGCRTFFTAHFSEALALRAAVKDCVIAVLHGLHPTEFAEAAAHDITPVLQSLEMIERWADFGFTRNQPLPAMIQLDTGMNRLGLGADEQQRLIAKPEILTGMHVTHWLSHFCSSEERDNAFNTEQKHRFDVLRKQLPPARASLYNSSGIFLDPDYHYDLVRPGVALYGANPTPGQPNPMQPVVELQTPILQVRHVQAGDTVGYNQTYRFDRPGKIATIPLGYADGYPRTLSNRGEARIGTFSAPIRGRVSMDLLTLDVTDIPDSVAHPGALACLIGPHRPIDQIASEAGTIAYEILTGLGTRVQRIYDQ